MNVKTSMSDSKINVSIYKNIFSENIVENKIPNSPIMSAIEELQKHSPDIEESESNALPSVENVNISLPPPMHNQPMPRLGNRRVAILNDADGNRVLMRTVSASDIVDALRVKLLVCGIFPYLLLNPTAKPDKKPIRTYISQTTNQGQQTLPNTSVVNKIEDSQKLKTDVTGKIQPKPIEKKKKAIPLPPPLPTRWPPVVVDGKNVGGDSNDGKSAVNRIGEEIGAKGSMSGAKLGSRGASAKAEPTGPKRKALFWDMITSTKGTLWEELKGKTDAAEKYASNSNSVMNEPLDEYKVGKILSKYFTFIC
jgi:hypothetical protein